jgi:hypothetical protein
LLADTVPLVDVVVETATEGSIMQDHAMVVRADARAMGAVTALSTTNRRKPRTYVRASECISYMLTDKSDAIIFKSARAERRATTTRSSSANAPKRTTPDMHKALLLELATIGDQNH